MKQRSLSHTFTSQPFAATITVDPITKIKRRLVIGHQAYYQTCLNKLPEGTPVTLIITNKKPKRTEQQNRFYWLYLGIISQETGEQNIESLHELFKGLFLTTGITYVLGKPVRMKKSTTSLTVTEFSDYIMAIETETGIQAPPAADYGIALLREGLHSANIIDNGSN